MTIDGAAMASSAYPVRFDVERPAEQSRLTNFPLGIGFFIRGILLIPHLVILYFFGIAANVIYLISTVAILFTGRYPRGLFNFYAGYMRWYAAVYSYLFHLYDKYPPFGTDPVEGFPMQLSIDYPPSSSRLLNFPILGLIIKAILLIPHLVILFFLYLALFVVLFIATFAILFTGSFPAGMHRFVVGVGRWYNRVQAYLYALTDKYPPFGLS
ncbi:MAG TPA: DUF4389 domain-containing protein [Dehalococcoidia bacterium]|nr:DUF4389 domain-containing protein [Dehalococcoidia bacterium]